MAYNAGKPPHVCADPARCRLHRDALHRRGIGLQAHPPRRARSFPRPRIGSSSCRATCASCSTPSRPSADSSSPRTRVTCAASTPPSRALDPLLDRIIAELRDSGLERRRRQGPGPAHHHRQESGRDADRRCASMARSTAHAALQLLDTDIGQRAMTDFRHQLRELYDLELRALIDARASSEKDLADLARAARGREPSSASCSSCWSAPCSAATMRRREQETEAPARATANSTAASSSARSMLFHLSSSLQKVGRAREGGARPRIAR